MEFILPSNMRSGAMHFKMKHTVQAKKNKNKIKELFSKAGEYKEFYHDAISKIEERENNAKKGRRTKKAKK
jgi:23S rRNA maturation mini-RNase III